MYKGKRGRDIKLDTIRDINGLIDHLEELEYAMKNIKIYDIPYSYLLDIKTALSCLCMAEENAMLAVKSGKD